MRICILSRMGRSRSSRRCLGMSLAVSSVGPYGKPLEQSSAPSSTVSWTRSTSSVTTPQRRGSSTTFQSRTTRSDQCPGRIARRSRSTTAARRTAAESASTTKCSAQRITRQIRSQVSPYTEGSYTNFGRLLVQSRRRTSTS
jgi:hypothetical protein